MGAVMARSNAATPLTRAQAKTLATILGKPLPREYSRLLRAFPDVVSAWAAEHGPDTDSPLFRDPATVIRENELVRAEDVWTVEGPWPDDHLVIGAEVGGDKFSLCVTGRPAAVYRLNHETGELERVGTLRTYVNAVKRLARGDAATITDALGRRKERTKKEPAWMAERGRMASGASARENAARLSNVDTDWGDAALGYEAADDFVSALRCCDEWIARTSDRLYPLSKKADYIHQLVRAETGAKQRRSIRGQYAARYSDLRALHVAHIAAVEEWLAAMPKAERSDEQWRLDHAKKLAESS